ncbi:Dessication-associated protein [Acidisarcina polymorpha]|uniref:Dessication-associated protein n=1 Tax=Acidisarcina polymorpha TaxID=2211140 RepID=A0A2Z5G2Y5_9BACT|nr:ferritin-like domain-containing protein [Acidisarcina polymorpha]AXC13458.1 Dessication-associated protein [Acidisarcina polymorpha]
MTNEEEVQAINQKVADRRAFLKSAGFTGLGLASAGILAGQMGAFDKSPISKALGMKPTSVMAAENADIDGAILNFALNLEYLEAEFYTVAVTGKRIADIGISGTGTGSYGPTTGGNKVNFTIPGDPALTSQITNIATELYENEVAHVKLLRSALSTSGIAKPAINLGALGIGFANVAQFITLARAFEDTGLSAYNGAVPLITSKAYLATAAQIALTESNHSGLLRYLCALTDVKVPALDSLDVVPPPAGFRYFNVSLPNALATTRTTDQVLAIIYGNSAKGTSKGAFFPDGLNGAITTIMG